MSQKEINRLEVIQKVLAKQCNQNEAAKQLHLSTRQVRNLQRKYLQNGAAGLVSKHRGKPSNNQLDKALKERAIKLIKKRYPDFGPTFAHEKLTEQHQLKISVESLRQLMIAKDIWQGKKRKKAQVHPMRARRSRLGELIQIDGSPHDWFEGRAPACCLLVYIDDATSRIMQGYFTETESTQAYFSATEAYLKKHGRPLSLYSDRHGIFRVNITEAKSGTGETQFGRAMRELGIELICANSPQAKGRVEKANATLQDRLVKEMRLKDISSIPTANIFLTEFIEDYNKRFAILPANSVDAHCQALPDESTLCLILSQQHPRQVSKNLELSYNNVIYQIQSDTPSYTLRNASVTVCDRGGEVTLRYKHKILPYKTFNKNNRPTKIVESKSLNSPKKTIPTKPHATHPWRRYEETGKLKEQRAAHT